MVWCGIHEVMRGDRMTERWLTAEDVAEYIHACLDTVRYKARKRLIPAVKVGKRWLFRASVLDEWIAAGCPSQAEQPGLFDHTTPGP